MGTNIKHYDLVSFVNKAYRDRQVARRIVDDIREAAKGLGEVKIMGFCGTHEYTITYYGIRSLMPDNVELIAGPGCPVCIVPAGYIDVAVKLAMEGIRVYTYGDMYRVPGSDMSLAEARARGGKVSVVYSFLDALRRAKEDRSESVFFAVGFETTQPTVASRLIRNYVPPNLKLLVAYRLTPPIMKYALERVDVTLDGVIAPGHVSTVIGSLPWSFLPNTYKIPTVVAGFEPIDVLIAILMILKQLNEGTAELVNEYTRVVKPKGNVLAKKLTFECFKVVDSYWRGLGLVKRSGLALIERFKEYDALETYGLKVSKGLDVRPGCRCHEVIMGKAKPTDCPLFLKVCTPNRPQGPCMVSSEGTCSIWARYSSKSTRNISL